MLSFYLGKTCPEGVKESVLHLQSQMQSQTFLVRSNLLSSLCNVCLFRCIMFTEMCFLSCMLFCLLLQCSHCVWGAMEVGAIGLTEEGNVVQRDEMVVMC